MECDKNLARGPSYLRRSGLLPSDEEVSEMDASHRRQGNPHTPGVVGRISFPAIIASPAAGEFHRASGGESRIGVANRTPGDSNVPAFQRSFCTIQRELHGLGVRIMGHIVEERTSLSVWNSGSTMGSGSGEVASRSVLQSSSIDIAGLRGEDGAEKLRKMGV